MALWLFPFEKAEKRKSSRAGNEKKNVWEKKIRHINSYEIIIRKIEKESSPYFPRPCNMLGRLMKCALHPA